MGQKTRPDCYEPTVVVLYCRECVETRLLQIDSLRKRDGFVARLVVMPCSSKVDERLLLKLLEKGSDAILVVACPDHACKFLIGSIRAERRVQHVRRILEEIGMGPERVSFIRRYRLSETGLLELAADRAKRVRMLGPSPAGARQAAVEVALPEDAIAAAAE